MLPEDQGERMRVSIIDAVAEVQYLDEPEWIKPVRILQINLNVAYVKNINSDSDEIRFIFDRKQHVWRSKGSRFKYITELLLPFTSPRSQWRCRFLMSKQRKTCRVLCRESHRACPMKWNRCSGSIRLWVQRVKKSDEGEVDTKILLHAVDASANGETKICMHSPDTHSQGVLRWWLFQLPPNLAALHQSFLRAHFHLLV